MGSGERLNGIQEVSGSIPLISTKKKDTAQVVSFFFARLSESEGPCSHARAFSFFHFLFYHFGGVLWETNFLQNCPGV